MFPEKTDTHATGKSKKIFLGTCIILLFCVTTCFAYPSYLKDSEYQEGLARLRLRFESIGSERQIDGFIEDIDRFVKRYPSGADKKDLERVREYVAKIKNGLPLQLVVGSVNAPVGKDTVSANDVFVVITGPFAGERNTEVVEDNDNPTFNFDINFTWRINSRPFIFHINDSDATNFDRIGTVVAPCNGITGWRQLDKKEIKGFNDVTLRIYLTDVPDCPW